MKYLILLLAISTALSDSIFAGPTSAESKMVVPAVEYFGTGWYGAIDGGVNVYQHSGDRNYTNRGGHKISLEPSESVGGFGGLKLGYVFGTGFVRPALEADCYYNGIQSSVTAKVDGRSVGSIDGTINTGAFMANSLLRFNFDRFQPYLGFGLGCWVAQANDIEITHNGHHYGTPNTNNDNGFAWQLVAGADYYLTPKISTFLEYKFLNYADAIVNHNVAQQLVGAGVRFHF